MARVVQVTTSGAECYELLHKLEEEDNKLRLNENNLIALFCSEVVIL